MHLAFGVDLDPEPLARARRWRLAQMKYGADRVRLVRGDVLHARDGLFLLAMYGGADAIQALRESRRIPPGQGPDGRPLPAFRYVWRQDRLNPITQDVECSIDFEIPGRRPIRRAFEYDWCMWTLPEVRELLAEAGLAESRVYLEGRDDGVYHRRASFENQDGWLALVARVR